MYEYIKSKKNECNKKIMKIKVYINTTIIVLIFFYVPRCEPLVACAKEVINVVIAPFVETTDKEEEIVQPETTDKEEEWIRIFLEYPDGYPRIDNTEYEELYNLLFYAEEENLNDIIKNEVILWLNSCENNTPLDVAITASGRSTEYYLNLEFDFFNDKRVLSSNLLDEVIDGRKELFDLFPNGTVAWLLANYYQTYALNYLKQTNDERSILYFYMKSIQYAQKSLEFEMNNEIKYERIKYLQARYKDIAECESIDENVRLEASKIYIEIQEVLNELQIL